MPEISTASQSGREHLLRAHPDLTGYGLDAVLKERLDKWERETERKLENIFPFREEQRAYENAMHDVLADSVDRDSLINDIRDCPVLDDYQRD